MPPGRSSISCGVSAAGSVGRNIVKKRVWPHKSEKREKSGVGAVKRICERIRWMTFPRRIITTSYERKTKAPPCPIANEYTPLVVLSAIRSRPPSLPLATGRNHRQWGGSERTTAAASKPRAHRSVSPSHSAQIANDERSVHRMTPVHGGA